MSFGRWPEDVDFAARLRDTSLSATTTDVSGWNDVGSVLSELGSETYCQPQPRSRFSTSEGGAVPTEGGFPEGNDAAATSLSVDDDQIYAVAIQQLADRHPEIQEVLDRWNGDLVDLIWPLRIRSSREISWIFACLGLYPYECSEQNAAPYARRYIPTDPLHASDLPSALSERFQPGHWPQLFQDQPLIQPPAVVASRMWGSEWIDIDGTLHPRFPDSDSETSVDEEIQAYAARQLQAAKESVAGPVGVDQQFVRILRKVVEEKRGTSKQEPEH